MLGMLLPILYTSDLFHVVGNPVVCYANDAATYAVISRPLLRYIMMELLNQNLAAIDFWV